MEVVRDLSGGPKPAPMDLFYNGSLAVDSVTKRYKGSLVKMMDYDDVDHGQFLTFGGLTTACENIVGILEEDQPITGNYLPDDASYGMTKRKITPLLQSSIVRAEYVQQDAAGTATLDTGATASASSSDFTISITTADTLIGGWIYMTNGSAANYLNYVKDNGTTKAVFATATAAAVASGDDFIVIRPPFEDSFLFDDTFTGLQSEIDDGALTHACISGLQTWIKDDGIPMQILDRNKHDGLKLSNPKFYHDFIFTGVNAGLANVFQSGMTRS